MEHTWPPHILHLTIALRIAGISVNEETTDLVHEITQHVGDGKGTTTINDITDIVARWKQKYSRPDKPETVDR